MLEFQGPPCSVVVEQPPHERNHHVYVFRYFLHVVAWRSFAAVKPFLVIQVNAYVAVRDPVYTFFRAKCALRVMLVV